MAKFICGRRTRISSIPARRRLAQEPPQARRVRNLRQHSRHVQFLRVRYDAAATEAKAAAFGYRISPLTNRLYTLRAPDVEIQVAGGEVVGVGVVASRCRPRRQLAARQADDRDPKTCSIRGLGKCSALPQPSRNSPFEERFACNRAGRRAPAPPRPRRHPAQRLLRPDARALPGVQRRLRQALEGEDRARRSRSSSRTAARASRRAR